MELLARYIYKSERNCSTFFKRTGRINKWNNFSMKLRYYFSYIRVIDQSFNEQLFFGFRAKNDDEAYNNIKRKISILKEQYNKAYLEKIFIE